VNLKQTVYFMALVGAIAGLLCWTTQVWLSDYLVGSQERNWLFVGLSATLMGAFIGGMTVGFADRWTADKVVPSWVLAGVLLGAIAGILSGALYIPLEGRIAQASSPTAAVVLRSMIWLIAGGLIGLVTGLRWVSANPLRPMHSLFGGLLGGALGGAIVTLGPNHEFFQALAYMLTGMGITLGVTLAPVLLSDGVLVFVSSGDPRAQNKYGSPRQEWVIQDGDRLVIGSMGASTGATMYGTSSLPQVYIPDAMVAPRHAILFASKKRFFVQLHADNTGQQGQPLEPLQLDNTNIAGTRELHTGDELIVGQTLLRFMTKRKDATLDQYGERRRR
jgi:hypothetical protein